MSGPPMCRLRLPASLLFASLLLVQCGCPAASSNHTYPDDPLFLSKKPFEAPQPTGDAAKPSVPAPADPQVPAVPAVVRLAAAGKQ